MKFTATILLFITILLLAVTARAAQIITQLNELPCGSTNSFVVDTSDSSALGLQVSFTSGADKTTSASVTLTATPAQGNGLGIFAAGTNTLFTWTTNTPTGNQIAIGDSPSSSTTNLFTVLTNAYIGILSVSYTGPTNLFLATVGNPSLGSTNSGSWVTFTLTTNAIAGGVIFVASNSLDAATWFPDTAKNFTLSFSASNTITCYSNWNGLGSTNFYKFSARNAFANGASPFNLKVISSVKQGF